MVAAAADVRMVGAADDRGRGAGTADGSGRGGAVTDAAAGPSYGGKYTDTVVPC